MLVIGSESHGISENVSKLLDVKSGIPKAPESNAESLNAAVACAILLAHFQYNTK
jgi:tRNA G18 (ribose-2'-O)-methylase SpoU